MTVSPEDLHVIRCYERLPPLPGGMERHIAELTAAQRCMGVRVTEIFNRGEPQGESIRLWRGRKIDQVRPYLLRSALFYLAASLRRLDLRDGRIRVIHVHGDWPAFQFGSMLSRAIRADVRAASLHSAFHAPVERYRRALRGYDPIFTTGANQARELSEALGRQVIQVQSAPAELFFEQRNPVRDAIDIVAVGSLVPVKNFEMFIGCAARRPELKFAIIGTGPEEAALRRLVADLHLRNVDFLGAMAPEEVRSVLQSARIFMNTSMTEGSPTAALEAMACGLPVLLTPSNDYGAIVEQGVTGYIAAGWDGREMVKVIDEFLNDPPRLRRAEEGARRIAQAHRWQAKAETVTKAMIEAAGRHSGRR